VFDPAANTWEQLDDVPAVVNYGSAITPDAEGRVWAFGIQGINRFDPQAGSWQTVATPRRWPNGIDGALLLDDGSIALLFTGAGGIHRYDPQSGGLTLLAQLRVARYNARLVELPGGTFAVAGGYPAGACAVAEEPPEHAPAPHYELIDTFSTATGTWQAVAPAEWPIVRPVPVVVNGVLYLIGLEEQWNSSGSDPFRERAELVVAQFTPATPAGAGPWLPGPGGCGG
jgi:hypothetical protein